MSKILERIINKRLNWIIESTNLYAEYQNGGRGNRSTMDSILQVEDTVLNGFRNKKHTIATFLLTLKKRLTRHGLTKYYQRSTNGVYKEICITS